MLLHLPGYPRAPQDPGLADRGGRAQQHFGGLLENIYDHLQTRPSFFTPPLLRYGPDGWHIAKEGGE
jgi:hypothetical protein